MNKAINEILKQNKQSHLLKFYEDLDKNQQKSLMSSLQDINWEELNILIQSHVLNKPESEIPDDLEPAPFFPGKPVNDEQEKLYIQAKQKGKMLLSKGSVAAFTVAGGQGTRLGFDGPKGTYQITPIKHKTLFQYFAESIKRASEKYNSVIPWYIMTSEMNDITTRDFFEDNSYFGLSSENVMFFKQGTMPVLDHKGKILLEDKGSIAIAPNGHGGSLLALRNSGALDDMKNRGIDYISFFQVDNPLVSVVNPLLIGLHAIEKSEMSSIMLSKTGPFEKLGNFCISKGRLMIIEYSDIPDELAEKKDSNGKLCFIGGSPAIHVISRHFVERLTEDGFISLPWHRADKKVSYLDENGEKIIPDEANAVKLETFIFDALPLADKTIILEADRDKEFGPTKNKIGVDSVESCREMLIARDSEWLEEFAGISIPKNSDGKIDCEVELSPLKYIDGEDVLNDLDLRGQVIAKREKVYIE